MDGRALLHDLVVLYALALALLIVGGRLRLPTIVSLILTGVLAGPGMLGVVESEASVAALSELGVALLLFMVGLDLPFGDLLRLGRTVAVGGSAQVAGTMAVVAPLAWWWRGPGLEVVLFVSVFVALSSTSILVRELTRRNELHAPHGALALGVLLLQDLFALLVLVLAPALFGSSTASLGGSLARMTLVAVVLTAATRFLLPGLFRLATASGREAFGLLVLVASLGTAWLASTAGLSMSVGAFLAGLVIDETEFSHQIHAEIRPIRDLLTSLFFISIGLLVDPAVMAPLLPGVVLVAVTLVTLKTAGATAALWLTGVPARVAATTGLGLAQIGEFSFVLGSSAVAHGAVDAATWQVLLGAGVLSMMVTPSLVGVAPAFGAWVGSKVGAAADGPAVPLVPTHSGHVVILGFGIGGRLIAEALAVERRPYTVLDLNGGAVRAAALRGLPIFYGDATAEDALRAAGIERAAAVVAVLSDPGATERAVRAVRGLNHDVPIIVRTRYRAEAERMRRAGATLAIAEELEASLEAMAQLLARLDVPGNVAERLVTEARQSLAAPSQRPVQAPAAPSRPVAAALGEAPVSSYEVGPADWAVGRTLAEVDLRASTGVTVLAIRRGATSVAPPPVDWPFAAGDVLYLLGDPAGTRGVPARLAAGDGNPSRIGSESV